MEPLARRTAALHCRLGLYNHGGWGGEPRNLVAVCKQLHAKGHKHAGIVYNWHHGHGHIDDWAAALKRMQPYLHCLNLNGMNSGAVFVYDGSDGCLAIALDAPDSDWEKLGRR